MNNKSKPNPTDQILSEIESRQKNRKLIYRQNARSPVSVRKGKKADENVRVLRYGSKPAPRYRVKAIVKLIRNKRNLVGRCIDLSSTGMFVNTPKVDFKVGEYVKLRFRQDGKTKILTMIAQVVRLNKNPKHPLGYGVKFISGF